jgi:hypothetical protein
MENRIRKKVSEYIEKLKSDVWDYVKEVECGVDIKSYLSEYNGLNLTIEDFKKRKRVKSVIPQHDRCNAKRADGNQCTRRRKGEELFCGTHLKGRPHGVVSNPERVATTKKVMVWAEDIKGIIYYVDKERNVYDTTDIINNKKNPRVIAKYEVNE